MTKPIIQIVGKKTGWQVKLIANAGTGDVLWSGFAKTKEQLESAMLTMERLKRVEIMKVLMAELGA